MAVGPAVRSRYASCATHDLDAPRQVAFLGGALAAANSSGNVFGEDEKELLRRQLEMIQGNTMVIGRYQFNVASPLHRMIFAHLGLPLP